MPSASGEVQERTVLAEPSISPIEWRVALLAARDAERRGWAARAGRFPRLRRLFEIVTGGQGIQRLADERLERLRLYLCMKRRADRRADGLAGDLIGMGFTPHALRRLEMEAAR